VIKPNGPEPIECKFISSGSVIINLTKEKLLFIMKNGLLICGVAMLLAVVSGCSKGPGEGGNSTITGYVHVTDYNATFVIVQGEYPGANEYVYLIYGDDISYGDRVRTTYDGRFEFKYLREGKYKVYVYSEDSTLSGQSVVVKEVEITSKKQTIDVGRIDIKKN
jgi:outer membrane lipoprotein-sorting protein